MDGRPLQQPVLSGDLRGGQQGPAAQRRHAPLEDQRRLAEHDVAGVRLVPAPQRRLLQHAIGLPAAARPGQRRRLDGPGGQHAARAAARAEGAHERGRRGGRAGSARAKFAVDAAADATTPVGPLPEIVKDGRLHFLALELLDADGRELDRVVNWVQADCRWHELLKLPPARIDADVVERRQEGEETMWRVSLHNASNVAAVDVWVELLRGYQGEEILPTFWSDNALALLPGQRRELTARVRTRLLPAAPPHLMVEGWNVLPREFDVTLGAETPLSSEIVACRAEAAGDKLRVQFTASQGGPAGTRWTTWPVPIRVDDSLVRCVRVALKHGADATAQLHAQRHLARRAPPGRRKRRDRRRKTVSVRPNTSGRFERRPSPLGVRLAANGGEVRPEDLPAGRWAGSLAGG